MTMITSLTLSSLSKEGQEKCGKKKILNIVLYACRSKQALDAPQPNPHM